MYDAVTLDQLRALVAVVEEGSFSAAARKLRRVQSAVSSAMANLEDHLGVALWDRTTRVATLTPEGRAVLAKAQRVLGEVSELRQLTASLAAGMEPSVSLCVDALFPLERLIALCCAFSRQFPQVELRVDTQVLAAVSARVVSGGATLGIATSDGVAKGLVRHSLAPIRMIPVASPKHPLAASRGRASSARVAEATQIVLSERHEEGTEDRGVLSPRTWRVAELHTKHMMLRAGLGWGNLPDHVVKEDLAAGRLVALRLAPWGESDGLLGFAAIHLRDAALGPAHRWVLEQVQERGGARGPSPTARAASPSKRARAAGKSARTRR